MRCQALVLLASLVALACGGGTPPGDRPAVGRTQSTHTPPIAELPAAYVGQEPVLQHAAMLGMLPDTTLAAIVAKSPSHLAAATDAVEIFREYPAFFAEANIALGADQKGRLLEPATWAQLGIDAAGPIGAAVIVEKRPIGLFLISLADVTAFRSNIDDVARALRLGTANPSSVGERHIIRFSKENDVAILIQAQTAVVIVAARDSDLEPVLAKLVEGGASPTLADSARLAKSFSGFDYGEDVAGFVAFDTIAGKFAEARKKSSGNDYWSTQLEELETNVEDAKASGMPQSDIDELEENLAGVLEQYNRYSLREAAEAHFTDDILGSLGTLAFGMDLAESSTGMRLRIQATPDSLADRLLLTGAGPLDFPKRLQESPLVMLAGHIDRKSATELFTTFVNMEGASIGGFAAKLREEIDIDFDAWLSLVGGEMSGAFTVNRDTLAKAKTSEEMLDAFGMHILFEMRDEQAAQRLFEQALSSPKLKRYRSGTGNSASLDVPSFNNRPIRITLSGRHLEARSLGPAQEGAIWHSHEQAITGRAQNMALGVFDPMVIQWLIFSISPGHNYYAESVSVTSSNGTVPPKLLARLAKVSSQIEELEGRQSALRNTAFLASSSALGRIAMAAQREPAGDLAIYGALVGTAKNAGRGLQTVSESMNEELEYLRTGKRSEAHQVQEQLSKLRAERWELWNSMH